MRTKVPKENVLYSSVTDLVTGVFLPISVNKLKNKKVVDTDGVEIGKVEDIELNDSLPWSFECLVVKTGTVKITGKRIRIKPEHIY
ncbi:MAG: PRC-barrel domain-containing protein [Candidatus Bathyarchaeota archaeon]